MPRGGKKAATATAAAPLVKDPARYKTELCATYSRAGTCPYGHKCQFAHGVEELRVHEGLQLRLDQAAQHAFVQRSRGQQKEDEQRQRVVEFRRLNKCSTGEARYYLDECDFDMAAALKLRLEDLAWERDRASEAAAAASQAGAARGEVCGREADAPGGRESFGMRGAASDLKPPLATPRSMPASLGASLCRCFASASAA